MFIKVVAIVIASVVADPVATAEKPAETVTITIEMAEKLTQLRVMQQQEIAQLKQTVYLYQLALDEARTKMCA